MAMNFLAGVALFVAASWNGTPRVCPIGTTLHATLNAPKLWRAEYCVDLLGQKEGPARLIRGNVVVGEGSYRNGQFDGIWWSYDDEGKSQWVTFYSNGMEISSQMTLDGLRNAIEGVNIERRRAHKPSMIEVVDEHTLAYRYTVSHPIADGVLAAGAMNRLRETLSNSRDFCELFSMSMTLFEDVRVAIVDSKGRQLGTTIINKKDCTK